MTKDWDSKHLRRTLPSQDVRCDEVEHATPSCRLRCPASGFPYLFGRRHDTGNLLLVVGVALGDMQMPLTDCFFLLLLLTPMVDSMRKSILDLFLEGHRAAFLDIPLVLFMFFGSLGFGPVAVLLENHAWSDSCF